MKTSPIYLLVAVLSLVAGNVQAQDTATGSAIVEIDAFSGRPNPMFYVDLTDGSKLAEAVRSLAYDARVNALTPQSDTRKAVRTTLGNRGIVITDPSGGLMEADASIVVTEATITTVKKGVRTAYVNSHPELYKLLIKHAYQAGALDRRAAAALYGK